jgi:hypothetical protein
LLLRAALFPAEKAIPAWNEWKEGVRIDRLDAGSLRLLPLVYKNLRAHGIDDVLMEDLQGAYRSTWARNRILFRNMAALLRLLHAAGIRTLLLKGAPLVLLNYKDYGLRPMFDFDVLVGTEDALSAFNLLKSSGWTPYPLDTLSESVIALKHAASFKDSRGRECDLHWHVLPECCQPGADRDFWERAAPIEIEGVPTLALDPADHLLHVCAHGVKWNELPPLRWIADAMAIVKSSEVNWQRVIAQAQKRRLVQPIKEALGYLRENWGAPIPSEVVRELERIPLSKIEEIEHRYRTEGHRQKIFGHLPALWLNYLRAADDAGAKHGLAAFFKYLQSYWGLARPGQLPLRATVKTVRRIRKTVSGYMRRRARMPAAKR